MDAKFNEWQSEVYKDKHRFKVICAGRRSGKSVLARTIVYKWATEKPGRYWIVSPTYKQAKSIHWSEAVKEIPKQWIKKKHETELSFTLQNGSVIELKGAENPDALRGIKLRGLVIDEVASIRNWDWLWQEVLRPTLTDYEAPAIFISTPKGYNHFFELYSAGQSVGGASDSMYKSWRFTSYDNPYIPKLEIDAQKKELTEDQFAQEFLADFRKFTGLVFKDFQREINVVEPFDIPEDWQIYRGYDYGTTNPTVFLWIGVDMDDNWFIFDEIYERRQTPVYFGGRLHSHPHNSRVVATYGDPSAAGPMLDYAQNQRVFITPANKETGTAFNTWVRFGIEKVAERLKLIPGHTINNIPANQEQGLPKLFIFSNCINTIKEIETYRWKEKSVSQAQDLNEPDTPEKANDHAMDALRYFAVSYRKMDDNLDDINKGLEEKWKI